MKYLTEADEKFVQALKNSVNFFKERSDFNVEIELAPGAAEAYLSIIHRQNLALEKAVSEYRKEVESEYPPRQADVSVKGLEDEIQKLLNGEVK